MKRLSAIFVCLVAATGFVAALAHTLTARTANDMPPLSLAPFEFHREAAATPEAAARSLFQGVSTESPKHFVQHLLLGVCDGSIDTLQKFAESLHATEFTHNGEAFTFYDLRDLRRGINPKKPVHVVASGPFDAEDERVRALQSESLSTYYAEAFAWIDAEAESYDGRVYRTRIVVAQVDGGWYAIPRCRSSRSFYKIADAVHPAPADAKEAD